MSTPPPAGRPSDSLSFTAESVLQSLIDNAPAAIYVKDLDGKIVIANQGLADILKRPRQEIVGKTSYDFYPREIAAQHIANDRAILKDGKPVSFEEIVPQEGGDRTFISVKFPVTVPGGETVGVGGVSTEITERKRAEAAARSANERLQTYVEELRVANEELRAQADELSETNRTLRKSEERFSTLFHHSPNPAFTYDAANLEFLEVNPAFCELVRFSRYELLGRTAVDLGIVTPDDATRLARELETTGSVRGAEVRMRARRSESRWVIVNATRLDLDDRRAVISTGTDITESKRLQDRLLQAQKMEAIGRLAGGVAHDFNNFMSIILGHAELALDSLLPNDRLREDLSVIVETAHRAAEVVAGLLAFSRQQIRRPQKIDVNQKIRDLIRSLPKRALPDTIQLHLALGKGIHPVDLDVRQFDQVVKNILLNARDAMPDGGTATIETANVSLERDYVQITITDTGVGMDEATRANVFEPFFTTKGPRHGTGLGLAVCYGILDQNDGLIELESKLGHGTTVRVCLPPARD